MNSEDEREFDYGKGSKKGPGRWGELKKEWGACKKGNMQSPIDLSDQRVKVIPNFGDLKWNYRPANASVKNRGHDIAVIEFFTLHFPFSLIKKLHPPSPPQIFLTFLFLAG